MLWAPLESATAAWSTTFVKDQAPAGEEEARSKRVAEWTLSGFWLCFMGSRLLLMAFYHNLKKTGHSIEEARVTHIVLAALVLLAMLGLTRSRRRGLTIGLILSAGLLMGPFFPNLMAVLLDHSRARLPARGWRAFRRRFDRVDADSAADRRRRQAHRRPPPRFPGRRGGRPAVARTGDLAFSVRQRPVLSLG
ncbi:MAG: hypothetical protein H7A53_01390 [Akkermansiaceae bacterium]|nr:hypothetical protein [Akkermansiaceae bacterium]